MEQVRGVSWLHRGEPVQNPPRPPMESLDELPIPDRSLLDLRPYGMPGILASSRGCAEDCSFCSCAALAGRRRRARRPEAVGEEAGRLARDSQLTASPSPTTR